MAQNIQGRFFWQELLTEDPAAVTGFYGKVLGWRAQPAASDPTYITFAARSNLVAGAMALGKEGGAHSHWVVYIGAEDVDATLANAQRLGGKVVQPAADIEQGRYAVIADPQGATFGVYKPKQVGAGAHTPQPGEHCWLELASNDLEAAFKFYQELFAWEVNQRLDMGPSGTYLIFGAAGTPRGGIYKLTHAAPGPYWVSYTEVADLDKAVAAASKAGGRVLSGPMTVPGGARIAQLADPNGAVFAIHTAAKIPATAASPATASSDKTPATASSASAPAARPKPPPAKVPTLEAAKPPAPKAATPAPPAPAKAASKPAVKKAAPKKKAATKKKVAPKKKVAKKAAAKKSIPKRKAAAKKKVAKKAKKAKKAVKRSAKRAKRPAKRKAGKARRKK